MSSNNDVSGNAPAPPPPDPGSGSSDQSKLQWGLVAACAVLTVIAFVGFYVYFRGDNAAASTDYTGDALKQGMLSRLAGVLDFVPAFYFLFAVFIAVMNMSLPWGIVAISMIIVSVLTGFLKVLVSAASNALGVAQTNLQSSYFSIADRLSDCAVPLFGAFAANPQGGTFVSLFPTLATFVPTYLTLSAVEKGLVNSTSVISMVSIMWAMSIVAMAYRTYAPSRKCDAVLPAWRGICAGAIFASSLFLILTKAFTGNFTPFNDTSVAGGGLIGAGLTGNPDSGAQCSEESNQEFVCHAYRNGQKIA